MRKLLSVIQSNLFLFNCLLSFSILAQEATTSKEMMQSLLEMNLEELMEVQISTASKKVQTVLEAPSSITVFKRKELIDMGITSVEELMNFVPGFQATREVVFNQGYVVSARGYSTPQASYNILFMLDGEKLNDEVSAGALSINHFITLANVKQIEIIRGPGSALYGTSAFTGVVNLITKTDLNETFVSRGRLNSKEFYTHLSYPGYEWQASLFARHFEDDGQEYSHVSPSVLLYDPRKGDDLYLTYRWKEQLRMNARYMQRHAEDFLYKGILSPVRSNFDTEQNFVNVDYSLIKTKQSQLTFKGSYMNVKQESIEGTQIDKNTVLSSSATEENRWQLSADGHYLLNDRHELFSGFVWTRSLLNKAPYSYSDVISGQIFERGILIEESKRDLLSWYFEDHYLIDPYLEMTLGIRYDRYSDFGDTMNPRVAFVYKARPKTQFKLMYGEAFRAPSFRQTSSMNGLGNLHLKPETIKTAEVAWIQEYPNAQSTLTYFQNRSQDKIDTVVNPKGRTFTNLAGLSTAGLELEFSAEISQLNLRTSYTYLTKTEENPRAVAKQTFSIIANYHWDLWNFNLNGYYHETMEQIARLPKVGLTIITLDDYWVWNSALRYSWNKNLTFVAQTHNLLDKEFENATKLVNYTEGVPNRGRTYSLGVEVKF